MNRKEIATRTLQVIETGSYQNNLGETVSIKDQTEFAVKNTKLFGRKIFPKSLI